MQKHVSLSVTGAELYAAVNYAQDMLYCMHVLQSLGLAVNLPMVLETGNQGAVYLANNWCIGGRTRHIDVRQGILCLGLRTVPVPVIVPHFWFPLYPIVPIVPQH